MKQLKSSNKKSSSKGKNGGEQADRGCKCGLCEENSHYCNTCSKN